MYTVESFFEPFNANALAPMRSSSLARSDFLCGRAVWCGRD